VRILLPVHARSPGGLATSVRGLARALPAALEPDDELVVMEAVAGSRLARAVHEQVRVARAARGFDLVHLPDHRPLLGSRTPFLLTVYDVLYLDHPEWFPRAVAAYKRTMLGLALKKGPAVVVCGSAATRDRLLAHHPGVPARVIAPGVDPRPAAAGDGDYFVTVSVVEERKNHLGLLRAYREARRRGLRLRWKVVGPAGYGAAPILAELHAADGVDVVGPVGDAERDELLGQARFLAFPSLGEGFGFPPLEAMARGVPVVRSRGGALDETCGEASVAVEATDEAAWAEALVRLDEDAGLRDRLAEAGLRRARGFDWTRAAEQYVAAYHEAV
jgi:glycosyltransferase involved in cell wall biosynthesis